MLIEINHNGRTELANISQRDAILLDEVTGTQRGSFAFISNHVSGEAGVKGCLRPEISDRLLLSNPRYDRFLARKIEAVQAVTLDDVTPLLPRAFFAKVGEGADIGEMFSEAQATLLARYRGEDTGTAGQREGQAEAYGEHKGFRLKLATAKVGNVMRPVVDSEGHPTVDGIMVSFYEVSKTVHQSSEYKPVNSRADKIMRDTIEKVLKLRKVRVAYKHFNLCKGNFTAFSMNSATILGMVRDTATAELDAQVANMVRHIGDLPASPLETLEREASVTVN